MGGAVVRSPNLERLPFDTPGDQRGQDLVEFAIALPVLLLLLLGIMEVGVLIFSYSSIANAAREGARYGSVHPITADATPRKCTAPPGDSITAATCRLTAGLDPANVTVKAEKAPGSGVTLGTVTVEVWYKADLVSGPVIQAIGLGPTIVLNTVAVMNQER